MKNGKCPKCGNTDIAALERPKFTPAQTGNISLAHISLGFSKEVAKIRHYVCRKCGYLEHYIIDEDIRKL
jgi:predicted nucleic-acid-binding Zn-ribbon protein